MTFPAAPLGIEADLYLGSWTDMTAYIYQRSPVSIRRGRQNQSATMSPSNCSMILDNRDSRFTVRNPTGAWYGTLRQNTPFRLSVPNSLAGGGVYLRMEDDNLSNASCPDASALQITGTLDARIDLQLSGYNGSQSLMGKAGGSNTQSWFLSLNPDGTVTLWWWTTGAALQSATSTQPLPNLGRIMIRAVLSTSGETVTFYTAPTMAGSETQLGDVIGTGSTSLSGGTGTPVSVGTSYSGGVNGQVYEARVYSGTTLEADPVFSGQTAGATSFSDTQGNTWTVGGTAELSDRLYRFHGELASLPRATDPSAKDITTSAAAYGVTQRMQQQQTPASSAMYRAYTRLSGVNLAAYWPCEDGAGATQLGSALPGGQPMAITSGATLAASTQFACSDALPQIGKSTWTGLVPSAGITWTGNAFRFLLYEQAGNIPNNTVIARMHTTGPVKYVDVVYTTIYNGTLTLNGYDSTGTQQFTITGDFAIDGKNVRISVELVPSGGAAIEYTILVMLPGQEPTYVQSTAAVGNVIGAITSVVINPDGANMSSAVAGHISAQGTVDTFYDLAQPLNAWNGETAGNRYLRLCSEEAIGCRVIGFPSASVAMGNQTLQTISTLLQECEYTDMGMQFEPRDSLGLGYITRQALYNLAVTATAAYDSQELAAGFSPATDNQLTINDVTVSNTDGSTARQVLSSGPMSVQAPPDGIGRADTQITVNAASDSDLASLASWKLWVSAIDEDRYPAIPFDMARSQTPDTIPLLDCWTYLQLTGTPAWAGPPPVRQITAGFTETLGPFGVWKITPNGIPESPYEVAAAGTARADSGASTLHADITSTATSMTVTIATGSALWTTSSGDFPFDVLVAGERMTVTGITGSGSPQTFTVTRSVNSVVKAQTAGASVGLYNVPALAL